MVTTSIMTTSFMTTSFMTTSFMTTSFMTTALLPATGNQISMNQVQTHYGYLSGSARSLGVLGQTHLGISLGQTVKLSESFGGQA